MDELKIPRDISVQDFFESFVPETFYQVVKEKPIPNMEGTVFTLEVRLTGEGGAVYGVTIRDAKEIEVKPGSMEKPLVRLEAPVAAWRAAISGEMEGADMVTNPLQFVSMIDRDMYNAVKDTEGTVIFSPIFEGGPPVEMKLVMNGAESPAVKLSARPEDFYAMSTGKLSGPMAFMQGKLKIEGDMAFAMQLGSAFMRVMG